MFGVCGGCKGVEITNVKMRHVTDYGTEIIVNISDSKKYRAKMFVISGEFAKYVQEYIQLRPANVMTDRFFLEYYQGECQSQAMGKLKVAIVPKDIAKFLNLDEYKSYTGHSFRLSALKSTKNRKSMAVNLISNIPMRSSKRLAANTNENVNNTNVMPKSQNTVLDIPCDVILENQKQQHPTLFYETTNSDDQSAEKSIEPLMPMLPLTTALMKKKSEYYLGLKPDRFLHLLQLARQRKVLSDVKLMVTLRKLRLNEEFEVLGDLFDLDKRTTEQYYYESTHILIQLVDQLDNTNSLSAQCEVFAEPAIKTEVWDTSYSSDPIAVEPIAAVFLEATKVEPIATVKYDDSTTAYHYDSTTAKPIETVKYGDSTTETADVYADQAKNSDDHDDFEFNLPVTSKEDRYFLSDEIKKRTAECTLCHKFYPPRLLNSHMDSAHHLNVRNLNRTICGLCWKEYDTENLLKTHQKDAHGGGCYGCDLCGKLFSTKRYMSVHILTKHAQLKTYLCDSCGEGFPIQSSLRAHVVRKHMEPGHDCHLCDMKFVTAISLKDHICARHSNERPYQCKIKGCGKTFSWPSSFKSHKRVHANDKFECLICAKQFSFKGNLQNHMKTIHNQTVSSKYFSKKYF